MPALHHEPASRANKKAVPSVRNALAQRTMELAFLVAKVGLPVHISGRHVTKESGRIGYGFMTLIGVNDDVQKKIADVAQINLKGLEVSRLGYQI